MSASSDGLSVLFVYETLLNVISHWGIEMTAVRRRVDALMENQTKLEDAVIVPRHKSTDLSQEAVRPDASLHLKEFPEESKDLDGEVVNAAALMGIGRCTLGLFAAAKLVGLLHSDELIDFLAEKKWIRKNRHGLWTPYASVSKYLVTAETLVGKRTMIQMRVTVQGLARIEALVRADYAIYFEREGEPGE